MTSPLTYLRQIHGNLKWFNEKWFWSRRWKNYESFCQESRRRFLSDAACFLKSKGLVAHESDLDELKNRWGEHVAVLFDSRHSQEFYRNWTGAVGASNLIANIWDQCSRSYLVFALAKYANGITGQVLDYGCGTASISLSWQRTYAPASQLLLADVENLARDFVKFQIARQWASSAKVVGIRLDEVADSSLHAIFCIHVLEHLQTPSNTFCLLNAKLVPGGLLFLEAPWGGHPEHLPEAPIDWHQKGGARMLRKDYQLLMKMNPALSMSGVYRKCVLPKG